ncbi:murein L,D-transpeptidase [Aureimonas altamirensis]|uniref:L,D-transpeptidase family protein n=1 Tax=Aureimonas altamirensis TaxID=370622 RepID=UPI00203719B6|nr:murein L,D-transpeptidase family protein [Aureimonas altamirensis]MCM2505691.1 murein L,D-transpeptidase [Aureimonas altamirensis]
MIALAKLCIVPIALLLSGCVASVLDVENKAAQPISTKLLAEMSRKETSPRSPILIRIFKQESELEVWKQDRSGKYALLRTYPMCRWSGKLGPKTRDGDRQAPEGFYHVNASMLNPDSQYYLSFNLGYPNKLERAKGYTGDALMVHGACSSSGCFAMTDEGVSDIYAMAREALGGGQASFQVQAYPFRMTAANMAKHWNDPNFEFWMDLKRGNDLFETTRREPKVSYCSSRYVFDQNVTEQDPLAACPSDPASPASLIADRFETESRRIQALSSSGSLAGAHAYADGGMHPTFRTLLQREGEKSLARRTSTTSVPISRPDAALADPHSPTE